MVPNSIHRSKNKKSSFRRILAFSGGFLLLGLVLVVLIIQNISLLQKSKDLQKAETALDTRIEELRVQRDEFQANLLRLEDREYQEKLVREKGLYQKPGEEVVTIVAPEEEEHAENKEDLERRWWNPFTW